MPILFACLMHPIEFAKFLRKIKPKTFVVWILLVPDAVLFYIIDHWLGSLSYDAASQAIVLIVLPIALGGAILAWPIMELFISGGAPNKSSRSFR